MNEQDFILLNALVVGNLSEASDFAQHVVEKPLKAVLEGEMILLGLRTPNDPPHGSVIDQFTTLGSCTCRWERWS